MALFTMLFFKLFLRYYYKHSITPMLMTGRRINTFYLYYICRPYTRASPIFEIYIQIYVNTRTRCLHEHLRETTVYEIMSAGQSQFQMLCLVESCVGFENNRPNL